MHLVKAGFWKHKRLGHQGLDTDGGELERCKRKSSCGTKRAHRFAVPFGDHTSQRHSTFGRISHEGMGQRMGAKRTSLGCIFGVATTSFVKISRPRGKLSSLKAPLARDVGMLNIVSV